ncbi:hypothetical protein FRACYDRAFT_238901 [Fragilariopsis cylindrus CCMP1102]|uniref:DUF6824 domain-containing protein n=1 Tax=Fragilariopsis cylindrus CCMP1102 TaxID=635003 RepID=A0A1E7FDQ3_9STRA|nr:hypothetical protein FRACYDRAFT_238901 [Fragilariopsis cylindrus CCMP1102]|eukprot:OEU16308.1 hypothetical protein FRACYDRAFT_238901 [Fragilariopsis cylindrus CCMP1102]
MGDTSTPTPIPSANTGKETPTAATAMTSDQATNAAQSTTGPEQPVLQVETAAIASAPPPVAQDPAHALLSLAGGQQDLTTTGNNEVAVVLAEVAATATATATTTAEPVIGGTDNNDIQAAKTKKRKLNNDKNQTNNSNGDPPDFSHWMNPGEDIGDWDVLCGRGGESNNHVGNKRYRKVVDERKVEYRKINSKQRKLKTVFVRDIVSHINKCGGRFIDVDSKGKYYVVTMEKARKKTSQALRETKELKWLNIDETKDKKDTISNKNIICPFCKIPGHKTKIAKACSFHNEWLDANKTSVLNNINIDGSGSTGTGTGVASIATVQQLSPSALQAANENTNDAKLPPSETAGTNATSTTNVLQVPKVELNLPNESANSITLPTTTDDTVAASKTQVEV